MGCCCPEYNHADKLFVHALAYAWQLVHGHCFPRLVKRIAAGSQAGTTSTAGQRAWLRPGRR